jgi:hypothetical protein
VIIIYAGLIALSLLVLHRSDGGEVIINADQVTSLRTTAGPLHGLSPGAHCIIGLTDGKYVGVLETCREVKRQLESFGR